MAYPLRSPVFALLLILASLPLDVAAAAVLAAEAPPPAPAAAALEERLQRIAAAWREGAGAEAGDPQNPAAGQQADDRLAGVFVNGPGIGFSNGGFRNGGFYNGGFRNGGFYNGGFRNGGFYNGGFRNGGFRNGGWYNGNAGWRNHW
jgi:rSAM-associated Gly-rich repeat protein